MKSFGKIAAPDAQWNVLTAQEERRQTTKERAANYIALRRTGFKAGTWWQRLKRDIRIWCNRELFTNK